MNKKSYLILGPIALVAVSLGIARLLALPAGIADFSDHLLLALEEKLGQRRPRVNVRRGR